MEGIIVVIFYMVKQVSSSIIICEESQSGSGLLGSLGLDTLSVQVFGFGFIFVSFVCYNFFNNEQWPSEKVDGGPRDTGSGECKISEPTDKVENHSSSVHQNQLAY